MALDFSKSKTNTLANAIRKTEDANARLVKNIPVDSIQETPENEYVFGILDSDVNRLAEEIKDHGFESAITVIDLHNGSYQVISGHQRLRAMKQLGEKTIPCIVDSYDSEEEKYRKLLTSNTLSRKITPLGMARAIALYEEKVLTKEEIKRVTEKYPELQNNKRKIIARFFNTSSGQVYRYQALTKMPEEIQEMCKNPDFPWTALEYAASLTEEQKQRLLAKINEYNSKKDESSTISRNMLIQWIEAIKGKDEREAKREILSTEADAPSAVSPVTVQGSTNYEYAETTSEANVQPTFGMNEPASSEPNTNVEPAFVPNAEAQNTAQLSWHAPTAPTQSEAPEFTSTFGNSDDDFDPFTSADDFEDHITEEEMAKMADESSSAGSRDFIFMESALATMNAIADHPVTDANRESVQQFVNECESVLAKIKSLL